MVCVITAQNFVSISAFYITLCMTYLLSLQHGCVVISSAQWRNHLMYCYRCHWTVGVAAEFTASVADYVVCALRVQCRTQLADDGRMQNVAGRFGCFDELSRRFVFTFCWSPSFNNWRPRWEKSAMPYAAVFRSAIIAANSYCELLTFLADVNQNQSTLWFVLCVFCSDNEQLKDFEHHFIAVVGESNPVTRTF